MAALIPTATETPRPSPTPIQRAYRIQPGDTLLTIAGRFDIAVDDLMLANDIAPSDAYTLRVGDPDTDRWQVVTGTSYGTEARTDPIVIRFE